MEKVALVLLLISAVAAQRCSRTNPSCSPGNCCSQYGWCGSTSAHCGSGCIAQCPSSTSKCAQQGGECKWNWLCKSPDYTRTGMCPGSVNYQCCFKGSQWLTWAGSYRVENLDRTGRATFSSHGRAVDKFLLHTIEGRWPSNGDWESGINSLDRGVWPHFIVAKDRSGKIRIGQFAPLNKAGKALRGTSNRDGVIQVEIGAKAASPFTTHDKAITAAVRSLFRAVRSKIPGIPSRGASGIRWCGDHNCACSGAYGTSAPQRLTQWSFRNAKGIVGHEHAYDNTHWDPGCINPSALL